MVFRGGDFNLKFWDKRSFELEELEEVFYYIWKSWTFLL